jgi:SDR family mycofactocin-dependent oxidoreductase
MGRMDGRSVLVTGAARGLGAAHAITLAREGADLVVLDCPRKIDSLEYPSGSREQLDGVVAAVEALGRRAIAIEGDVRSQADLDGVVERAIAQFGQLDCLVANAGILTLGRGWELTEEQWQDTIDVNLTGIWHAVKAVIPHMVERQAGSMVLTSSMNGIEPLPNAIHYCAAKFGVIGVMKTVAAETARYNVRCNGVLPGFIHTDIHKWQGFYDLMAGKPGGTDADRLAGAPFYTALNRQAPIEPEEVSKAVLFLLSDEAKEITGIGIPIDAGHSVLPNFNPAPVQ